jgi:hypothetical protein
MTWGIRPETNPEPWWGARAIYKAPDTIDLLWDRQSIKGSDDERKGLAEWLNSQGLKKIKEVVKEARLGGNEFREVQFKSDGFIIVANPRESCGYLYMGAWEVSKAEGSAA